VATWETVCEQLVAYLPDNRRSRPSNAGDDQESLVIRADVAERAQQAWKPPADPVGRQLAGRAGPLPPQPLIGHQLAGQAQLGVAGQQQPGPPLGLLRVPGAWGGPAKVC
jgi:hypothetical protein